MTTLALSSEHVATEVRALMARKQLTMSALAIKAERTPMWLSRRLRGDTPLTVDDVALLAHALGVSPLEVLAVPTP